MDVEINEIACIRIKIDSDELQDLIAGERLVVDLDSALQIEIYHAPLLGCNDYKGLNGDIYDN